MVTVAMVLLWMTSGRHGLDAATVAVVGALALTMPGLGPLVWKEALASVSWDLVIFVAAALVLGEALIATGAAAWLMAQLSALFAIGTGQGRTPLLMGIVALSLTSHLYMTSHAARTVALLPPLLLLLAAGDDGPGPVAVAFIATVGIDYCLTLPVSSKALLMFQEGHTWRRADLLRLSAALLPAHFLLMMLFTLTWWRWAGLLP